MNLTTRKELSWFTEPKAFLLYSTHRTQPHRTEKLKGVASNLKYVDNNLKHVDSKLKCVDSNLKHVDSKLKYVDSNLKHVGRTH